MSRIIIITGEGRGKTTSAFGVALRAIGNGMRVGIIQFIKSKETGEVNALSQLKNVEIKTLGKGFVFDNGKIEEHQKAAEDALLVSAEYLRSEEFDLVILDEILGAVDLALIKEKTLLHLLRDLPESKIVILTGRSATGALMDMADTVSDIQSIKHALDVGKAAQKGVEF